MLSFGLYTKQFVFYLGLLTVLGVAGWVVQDQRSAASVRRPIELPAARQAAISMDVLDQGTVQIEGQKIPGAIDFLRDRDELRYLLLDDSDAGIGELTVDIHFPREVDLSATTTRAIIIPPPLPEPTIEWQDPQHLRYTIVNLSPGSTVTLEVGLPKGTILPSFHQRLFGTITSLPQVIWLALAIILPIITLLILGVVGVAAFRNRGSNVTEERPTPPEALAPAIAATLVEGRVSARAIAATLLDLARREYLEIGNSGTGYAFTKRRRLLDPAQDQDLAPFERALLEKIFSGAAQSSEEAVRVRIGSNLFSRKVAEMYLSIYEAATQRGYFNENPSITQGSYRLVGLALFFVGIIGFGFGAAFFSESPAPLFFWVGMILSALVVIAVAPHMPVHTSLGLTRRRQWFGFRNYLKSTQEIDYAAQSQEQFFVYLPYAVAMGVEVEWARRFLRTPLRLPDWYTSKQPVQGLQEFVNDVFPIVGFLAREMAAVKEPTLS